MTKNQTEFNEEFNNKETTEIRFKNEDFDEEQLIIENYLNLEILYLRGIESIDKLVFQNLPKLQKCTISNCGVKELIIKNCLQIRDLKVDDNSLTNLEFLKSLPNLQRLNVDDNPELASGLEYLPKSIKFSCDSTKLDYQEEKEESLETLQQKYENLKDTIAFLSKETQEELVGKLEKGIKAKEEASERGAKELKTDEIVLDFRKSVQAMKETKKELETNLTEAEMKIQKLEKELTEAKVRAEKRHQKIEELSQEQHSLETNNQTPLHEKTITFLRAKSIFLNARQETIGELKKCFIALENKFGKSEVIGETGNIVSEIGGIFDTVTFGIPALIGETIKAGNNFSQIMLVEKGNKEFQLSLKDEKELAKLHKDYDSLVSLIHNLEELEINILSLKERTRDGKARAFNINYEIFSILESKNIWKYRSLTLERMEETINALSENHKELESEWEEQFDVLKTKLGKEKADLFYQEQQIGAKTSRLRNQLESLKNLIKEKLKSTHWREKEKRNKERETMLNDLLNTQREIVSLGNTSSRQEKLTSLQNKLLEIASEHKDKEFKSELDKLCQVQIGLTQLQIELENLQDQQSQIQIPPK